MNRHLRLDLKSFGQDRKGLCKIKAEGPVTGHNILDIAVEDLIDGHAY
jgi:hypothetical protein